ncbi:MFS transporter [Microbacterium sp. MEC084]|uniref:MFS transporter n=1 Tax=Microbacterium sp. MEC084 TaxID=1963027 RepID=UPI00106FD1C1|nr:MFS transporter [Microbacterium sp. MEC084]MCD1269299.1 MFS transporter [Microbacterium sp. MEC084]
MGTAIESRLVSVDARDRGVRTGFLLLTLCLVAVNMRATITGIGPLLEQMTADTGVPIAALSGLTSVPLIAWALCSPLAHSASQRFGINRVMTLALALLAAGTVIRSLPGPIAGLWIGSAVIGVALAAVNVLVPAIVKRAFGTRVPAVTGLYTALLAGCGALASGVVVPISHVRTGAEPWGWRVALIAVCATLPIALGLWLAHHRRAGHGAAAARPDDARRGETVWRDRVAWQVGMYFGVQASHFYVLLTWLAPFALSIGRGEAQSGVDVMIYQLAGVVSSLALPLALRGRLERWAPALLPALAIVGVAGFLLAPDGILAWSVLAGLTSGASLAMSFTLMASRSRDHHTASALSGMAQSVGYAFAALPPIAFGLLHTATGGWTAPMLFLAAILATQAILGILVGRDRRVFER